MGMHVDKIDVKVSGGVSNLAVQGFELTVAVNSIPSIVIEALPITSPGTGTTASKASFSEVTSLYNDLSRKAAKLSTKATITITITSSDSGEKTQTITLKDWILSDVGLSSVTTYAAPTLTAVFRHRIVELDHYGSIYEHVENTEALVEFYRSVSGGNVIQIMDEVYDEMASENTVKFFLVASESDGGPSDAGLGKIIEARVNLSAYAPSMYLDCDSGLFLGGQAGEASSAVSAAIADIVTPRPFSGSTWTTIVQTVCPIMICNVIPTYDDKNLRLEPYEPWQASTLTLDSNKIEAIDVTSMDTDPIFGVAVDKKGNKSDYTTGDATRTTNPDSIDATQISTFACYFPDKDLKDAVGRIEYYAENAVLSAARGYDYGMGTGGLIAGVRNDLTEEIESKMLNTLAKGIFIANYRKHCKASVTSIPTFTDAGGNMIYPGRVLTVKDNESGSMFNGYLARMTIKGTAEGGGSAFYELMTARPAEGGEGQLVDEGTKNPCYE